MTPTERLIQSLPKLVNEAVTFDSDLAAAYHEGGHAVVMLHHGRVPDRATLDPPKIYHKDLDHRGDLYFLMELYMGGTVAAALYCGKYSISPGPGTDMEHIVELIHHCQFSYGVVERIWRQTHTILLNNWDILSLIASKLYREKEIDRSWFETILKWK